MANQIAGEIQAASAANDCKERFSKAVEDAARLIMLMDQVEAELARVKAEIEAISTEFASGEVEKHTALLTAWIDFEVARGRARNPKRDVA